MTCLVVAGMHRSGTSLLASALAAAGVDMGGQPTPGRGNPRGHFEDLDFVRFHDAALARRAAPLFAPGPDFQPVLAEDEERAARALLAARARKPLWGFKDPRATLFLETWRALAPEAFFLLLYRHPVEVALSLLRRGLQLDLQLDPDRAFAAWEAYNARLLAFRRAHRERALLVSVEALTGDLAGALARIAERAGAPLAVESGAAVLEPGELRAGLEARELDWSALAPAALALFAELEGAADLLAPAPAASRPARGFRDPARDAQFASEHLLAALLACGAGGDAGAERRIDFERLHILAAEQAEAASRAHEDAGVAWGLVRRLRADLDRTRAEAARALAEREAERDAARAHAEDEARRAAAERGELEARQARLEERHAGLERRLAGQAAELESARARLRHEEGLRRRLEGTRAWRGLEAYWRLARGVRGMAAGARSIVGGLGAPPRAAEVVVGCVTENNAPYLGETLRLLRSIELLGGELAAARRLVCVVDEVDAAARAELEAAGATVRVVPRFDPRNPSANRFHFFDQALALGAEFLLSLDCDTLVVRDPLPQLRRGVFQARIEPVASVEMAHFARLFPRHGLRLPRPRYRYHFDDLPTIRYCNAGVIALPAAMARRFVPVWRQLNARALDQLELLEGAEHHVHQATLALAFAFCPVPFRELPVGLNYQLNMTHRPAPPEFLACDPAILHYHHQVDADGRLHPVPYPQAQRRIEEFERLSGRGG